MKKRWWYRACPKCGGDVYESEEIDGFEFKCLQCSKTVHGSDLSRLEYLSKRQPAAAEISTRRAA